MASWLDGDETSVYRAVVMVLRKGDPSDSYTVFYGPYAQKATAKYVAGYKVNRYERWGNKAYGHVEETSPVWSRVD